jgi:hypothetical protein
MHLALLHDLKERLEAASADLETQETSAQEPLRPNSKEKKFNA